MQSAISKKQANHQTPVLILIRPRSRSQGTQPLTSQPGGGGGQGWPGSSSRRMAPPASPETRKGKPPSSFFTSHQPPATSNLHLHPNANGYQLPIAIAKRQTPITRNVPPLAIWENSETPHTRHKQVFLLSTNNPAQQPPPRAQGDGGRTGTGVQLVMGSG